MTGKIFNLVLSGALLMGVASIASATTMCQGYTISTTAGSNSCLSSDDLTYTFLNLSFVNPTSGTESGSLSILSDTTAGNDNTLEFQIAAVLPADVFLAYSVTGGAIDSIDASFNSTTPGTTLNETACSVDFPTGVCPSVDVLSTISDTTGGVTVTGTPATFGPDSTVYIEKDFEDMGTLSEFNDSIGTGTPEPMTLSFVGLGLLGMGLAGRRIRRAK